MMMEKTPPIIVVHHKGVVADELGNESVVIETTRMLNPPMKMVWASPARSWGRR